MRKLYARLIAIIFLLTLAVLSAAPAQARGPNRAGLVIRFSDGQVVTKCIEFNEPEISGLDLLQRAGLRVVIEQGGIYGGAVCKIERDGCDFPIDNCFCQCMGAQCVYWAYYHLQPDGSWQYSQVGAASWKIHDGDVDGWSWGPGTYGTNGTEPPRVRFDQICAAPATATNTPVPPTATATPVPPTATRTPTLTPTLTRPATSTLTATPAALQVEFWAERNEISAGQCTTLGWRVAGASAVYLDGQGVIGEEVRQVCPTADTTYTLRVVSVLGETLRQQTIRVLPATPTPPATATVPLTPTRAASAVTPTPRPPAASVPTTFTPTPAVATSTPAPTNTPADIAVAPILTATPEAVAEALIEKAEKAPAEAPLEPATPAPALGSLPTPQVWSRAYPASRAERRPLPTTPAAPTPRAENAVASPFDPDSPLLLRYGLFFWMAALLAGVGAWATRRQRAAGKRG
jgi:hypothetical protein